MKKTTKISAVMFFLAAVVLVFNFLPSLEASGQMDEFGNISKREELKIKIEELRSVIKAQGYTFTVDYNPAMQYTLDQLCNFKPELKPADWPENPIDNMNKKPVPDPTDTYYMSDYTGVRDQGSCGSCWAFSTAGMFEAVLLKQGINADLSEQWLVSCNTSGWGCNGGNFANSYFLNPGAFKEKDFRYKALDLPCKEGIQPVYIASGSYNASNISAIKNAIRDYGAVSSAITATYYFQAYSGGVFNYDSNSPTNHAIVIVGWDDNLGTNGAWRIKNSWGRGWGEGGMMWIEYGCSNVGSGGNYLTY